MSTKIWVNKARSFKEAEAFERRYYMKMTAEERLEVMQFLRNAYRKIGGMTFDVSSKRLRRVAKVIQ